MANIIKPKRTNTAGNTPTTSNLTSGELGVNMADQKTYINNGTAVVQIGAGNLVGLGDVNITSPTNSQALIYDSATSKWVNGAGGGGGTGTVTSVAATVPSFLSVTGSPITTSGTLAIAYSGTALPIANGGTGSTTAGGALTNLGAIGAITSTDGSIVVTPSGTTVNLAVSEASPASTLLTQVRNTTGATLTKGTVVYISGATGQIATVSKAIATGDATSAQTLGMITTNLANNTNGYVTVFGLLENMDTSAYTDGAQLYLSGTVAGAVTATKPSAPIHLVYVAVVEYAHPTQGKLLVKVQNGYELDEIHDVSIVTPVTGQTLVYNSATDLWVNNTVSLTAGVNGTLPILNGGTGQTTANAAFNALAPSQTGNSGKYLTTDGTDTSWAANPLGTVTSVSGTGTVSGLTLTGTVTTSGSLTLGGTLSVANSSTTATNVNAPSTIVLRDPSGNFIAGTITANLTGNATGLSSTLATTSGGTGLTSFTSNGLVYATSTSALTTGSALTFDNTANRVFLGTSSGLNTAYLQVIGNNSATADTRLILSGQGNGGSGRGSTLLFQAGGSNSSVDAVKLLALQESTSATANNASFVVQVADTTSGSLTERFRIDKLGNAGLSVVPSAWESSYRAFQFGAGSAFVASRIGALQNRQVFLGIGASHNGTNWIYTPTGVAISNYTQTDGSHQWFSAASGTAGNIVTFKQAMTLLASGELLIGQTATKTSEYFRVSGSGQASILLDNTAKTNGAFIGAFNDAALIGVNRNPSTGTFCNTSGRATDFVLVGSTTDSYIAFGTSTAVNTTPTERMRLDAVGNLGLGVTSSPWISSAKAIDIAGFGSVAQTSSGSLANTFNAYQNSAGNWIYKTTNAVSQFQVGNAGTASFAWYQAPSGTVGTNATFTQAMTLSASGNLLVGRTSSTGSAYSVEFSNGAADNRLGMWSSGTLMGAVQVNTNEFRLTALGASTNLTFQTNSNIRATIDTSGNLGLGVTPAAWVSYRSIDLSTISYSDLGVMRNAFYNGTSYIYRSTAAASQYQMGSDGSHNWYRAASGTSGTAISFAATMGLTSAGDLLLGRSSSPADGFARIAVYNTTDTAIQLTKGGVVSCRVSAVSTALAFGVDGSDGATERFRIASNGAWGLSGANYGTSGQVLTSQGSGSAPIWAAAGGGSVAGSDTQIQYNNSGAFGAVSTLTFNKSTTAPQLNITGTTSANLQLRATAATNGPYVGLALANADAALYWTWDTVGAIPLRFVAGGVEQMRISGTNNVSIGATGNNGSRLYVAAGIDDTSWSNALVEAAFGTSGNTGGDRYCFKATGGGGNNGIPYGIHCTMQQNGNSTSYGGWFKSTGAYGQQYGVYNAINKDLGAYTDGFCNYANIQTSQSGGSAFFYFGYDQTGAATRFYVRQNGGISNYQANNTNLSDRREKKDFAPAKSYLDVICAIPVQTFKYIDQTDDELNLGVVAQDVQNVAPELVTESNWAGPDDEPKMRLSIYQTDLQYALMKALQELKAEFDAYKALHP